MSPTTPPPSRPLGRRPRAATVRPLEPAQVVWRRAVELAGSGDRDHFVVELDLLRTAHHGPSTLRHALMLGRARRRDHPADPVLRDAVRLLERATSWLGTRPTDGEVGRSG
jgi:hypothetical protein